MPMIKAFKRKFILWLLTFAAMGISSQVFAVDLLELPAVQSEEASRALLLDVVRSGDENYVAVGEFGVVIFSEDGGDSWTQAAVPASVMLTAVHFPTPQLGWAVGHDGLILHSKDGGRSWEKQLDGHQLNEQLVPVAERIVEQNRAAVEELQAAEEVDEYALEDAEFMLEEAEFMLEGTMDDADAGPVRPLLDVWFSNER